MSEQPLPPSVQTMRNTLSGGTGVTVGWNFVIAARSSVRWPLPVWGGVVGQDDGRPPMLRAFYWLDGGAFGELTLGDDGAEDPVKIAGSVRPVSNIETVEITVEVLDSEAVRWNREIKVRFNDGHSISVTTAQSTTHFRDQANTFINAVLEAVAGR